MRWKVTEKVSTPLQSTISGEFAFDLLMETLMTSKFVTIIEVW